ncbi:hypothetical protein H1R17_09595 [Flavobacterium sp. xlx-214]|uniref:hypothetical protein n=1 Tax=unclassified Flavobacterium TaxID=196869 RepID=UPI0013D09D1E|nr:MULTISPECIES: hypothetical protein [unclassified Flavobacterium]MBA5793509.1 hypothetical protein [Flavobacterium sp. xlx-221]QMI82721.1 hypothetical protein H1R17_09595 [Flavobacterium sp. xlx-214]
MTLYVPYLIFIGISLFSFITAFIVRKVKNNKKTVGRHEKLIRNIILFAVGYYLIKFIFGWQLNWCFEAVLVLILCICFDYVIIVKEQYSHRLQNIYYPVRLLLIGVPIASFVIIFFLGGITLGFGYGLGCFVFPKDRAYGEQHVYKNLYIYKSEDCREAFVFKKKLLCFEKDVANIGSYYGTTFGENRSEEDPITGYISRNKDTIFITGKDIEPRSPFHIRITILNNQKVQIEDISPISYPISEGETLQLESHGKKIIRL